jgi:hypothetical protein
MHRMSIRGSCPFVVSFDLAGYTGSCRLTVLGWPKTPGPAATELHRIASLLAMVGISPLSAEPTERD